MAHQVHQAVDDLGPLTWAGDGAQKKSRLGEQLGWALMMGHQTQSSAHIDEFMLGSHRRT